MSLIKGNNKPLSQLTIWAIIGCAISTCAWSLPSDSHQVVQVSAGSADINQATHRGVYTDDVQLDQGTTHLRAATAITEGNKNNQLVKAIAKGNATSQAHYWTLPEANKPELHAFADIIIYSPDTHLIQLTGHAKVMQKDNLLSAHQIIYNTLTHHVISKSGNHQRTMLLFHPEKNL